MKTLVTQIVSAYVQHNTISSAEIPSLISQIYAALTTVGETKVEETLVPAVTVKKSVTSEAIICLECGKSLSMLKRHLKTDHDLTPAQYREKWKLPLSYPMTAPDYASRRSELALKIGLGRKKKVVPPPVEPVKPRRGRKAIA